MARDGQWWVRRRWWLLALWAIAQWWVVADHTGDWGFFRTAAGLVFGGQTGVRHLPGGIHTWASDPSLQFGPPAVLFAEAARLTGSARSAFAVLTMSLCLPTLWCIEATAIALGRSVSRAQTMTAAGGALLVYSWGQLAFGSSHLDDALALSGAAFAAWLVVTDRWWQAALVIGTAAAAKPWGVAAVPLLLLVPRGRRGPALALALGAAVAWWSPFLLDPKTLSAGAQRPTFLLTAPLHALVGGRLALPSWGRSGQLLAVVVAGALAARRSGVCAVVLAGIAVRLLVDSGSYDYYWTGLLVAAILFDQVAARRWPVATLVATVGVVDPFGAHPRAQAAVSLLVLLGALAIALGQGAEDPVTFSEETRLSTSAGSRLRHRTTDPSTDSGASSPRTTASRSVKSDVESTRALSVSPASAVASTSSAPERVPPSTAKAGSPGSTGE